MPTQYKKTLIQMFAILKHMVVARSVKIMDKLDHVFYVNGAMGMLDMIQKYISETKGEEKISYLRGKKPGQQKS